MSQRSDEEVLLRNYLLGNLDEAAREQVEERLLSDDDFEKQLSEAQDALIDDYVFDALTADERANFDRHFVFNDERRRKLLFAQTMKAYVGGPRPPARAAARRARPFRKEPLSFLRTHKVGAAVSGAVLLLLLAPFLLKWFRTPNEADLRRERRARVERRLAELNRNPADESVKDLPSTELALQSTLLRAPGDDGIPRILLTDDIKLLTLRLAPPEEGSKNYMALVLTVEGEELFAVGGLTPSTDAGRRTIHLNLPTEFLRPGDYQIQLREEGTAATGQLPRRYYFRVLDK